MCPAWWRCHDARHASQRQEETPFADSPRLEQRGGCWTEGIETQEDKNNMESLDCDYGQGYFYEKPINAEEFSIKYMS